MIANFAFQLIAFFGIIIGIYELLNATISKKTKDERDLPNYFLEGNLFERLQYSPYLLNKHGRGWFYLVIGIVSLFIALKNLIPIPEFCGKSRLIILMSTVLVLTVLSIKKENSKSPSESTSGTPSGSKSDIYLLPDELSKPADLLRQDFVQTIGIFLAVGTLTDVLSKMMFKSGY